jgi:hypothetical protein
MVLEHVGKCVYPHTSLRLWHVGGHGLPSRLHERPPKPAGAGLFASSSRVIIPPHRSAEFAQIGCQRLDLRLTEVKLRHAGGRLVRARVPQPSLDLFTAEASANAR